MQGDRAVFYLADASALVDTAVETEVIVAVELYTVAVVLSVEVKPSKVIGGVELCGLVVVVVYVNVKLP